MINFVNLGIDGRTLSKNPHDFLSRHQNHVDFRHFREKYHFSRKLQMDTQYYKQLFISVAGIYTVYLSFGLVQEKM